jgi:RNA polymerase sigma-70 factor (ECF subfamily)
VCKVLFTPDPEPNMDLSDPVVYARIYDEHARGVHVAAYRILGNVAQAQDVTQDVFVKVWRQPHKFDARRGELGSYLRLMARSRALDLWREGQAAGRASDRLKLVVARDEGRTEDRPAPMAERESERRAVRAALAELPPNQREAVVLAYWGGLTADQIARRADVPLGTAKSRIRLGLAKLRERIEVAAEPPVTATAEPLAAA